MRAHSHAMVVREVAASGMGTSWSNNVFKDIDNNVSQNLADLGGFITIRGMSFLNPDPGIVNFQF